MEALPLSMKNARQSADFHPSVWGDYFVNYSPFQSNMSLEEQKQRNEGLQIEIRKILTDAIDPLQSLELIDSIQRLGVAYHFQKEINDILRRVHSINIDEDDLYATALHFRLLRQERYHITSDVFNRFLEDNGDFQDCLSNNVKALLSLYDAAYLGFPNEDILEKAKTFSRVHLELLICKMDPSLVLMVRNALEIPLVRRIDRLKARNFIEIYDKYRLCNQKLLDFAKFDFNILQSIHQEEVRIISEWWKGLGFSKHLPFLRDRIVESYFWMLSTYSEPYYSRARVINAKVMPLVVATDDIYDVYGTLEELELFTDVIERWDLDKVSMLPEYMQRFFLALYNTFKEIEDELAPQHNSFRVHYLISEFKRMAHAYLQESKWASVGYVPKLEEHMRVSLITAGYSLITCASYLGMKEVISKDTYEWVASRPKILKSMNIVGRLMNDIGSYQNEQKRNHVASSIQCYCKEHGCSEMEACKKLKEMVEEHWKIINRELMATDYIPLSLIKPVLNLTYFTDFVYKDTADIYTDSSEFMKETIAKVLIEPVCVLSKD
ncbi:alpha-humulene synthase-like [Dendrobium catenatum]|uniref:Alpha-humulene synthase n=1 Tax=Dendrobium catenatum TaxID=906689 RepID=A0A2I0WHK0_9ASPA|nr:alpha-humulene synthase-like [Dendrobium catenatum]PKU75140.1 Alpha-humulene synthase [Dendrobium catenatum]